MKEKPLPKQLLSLKKKTSWSWERMCREFHRLMGEEGPSHTTLFRYATGRSKRRNLLTERYVKEAIDRVTVELQKEVQVKIHFGEFIENAKDIVYRYRQNPVSCEYINPAVEDILGYTPEEFYADPKLTLKIIHPDDRSSLEANFQDTFTLRSTRRWIHKNGKVVRCEGVYVPIYDEEGNLVAIEGISREVTDLEQN